MRSDSAAHHFQHLSSEWPQVSAARYRLTKDTFACLADDYLVFSDIDADKYHCLSPANAQAFASVFPIVQNSPAINHPANDLSHATRIAEALIQQGLLTELDHGDGNPPRPGTIPIANRGLEVEPARDIGHRDVARFTWAATSASFKLRFHPLRLTLRTVEARRLSNPVPTEKAVIRSTVAAFNKLRPYYPRRYICRFDSLALVEFLSAHDQHPLWIFGVKSKPFGAHCWVQDGEVVLNDTVEYVRRFTPIMAF